MYNIYKLVFSRGVQNAAGQTGMKPGVRDWHRGSALKTSNVNRRRSLLDLGTLYKTCYVYDTDKNKQGGRGNLHAVFR